MNFVCRECGENYLKWEGRCRACGTWGSLAEFREATSDDKKKLKKDKLKLTVPSPSMGENLELERFFSDHQELNSLFGGGLPKAAIYLLAGEPGVGKSTFLLYLANQLKIPCLYITGEESLDQIRLRMKRLTLTLPSLDLLHETDVRDLEKYFNDSKYKIIFIDSIQTVYDSSSPHSAGSIASLKNTTQILVSWAKQSGISVILTGHINKAGDIAGPKVLEHLVDGTFLMESETIRGSLSNLRVFRPVKNRFGPTDTGAIFLMTETGLQNVDRSLVDQKAILEKRIGSVLYPHFIGRRLYFSEIEALCVSTSLLNPKRSAEGISINRLSRLMAIIEKYTGLAFSTFDVYIHVSGGIRNEEVHMDLALIAALYSSLRSIPVSQNKIFLGEVGLGSQIHVLNDLEKREKEIQQHGQFQLIANGSPVSGHSVKSMSDLIGYFQLEKIASKKE